MGLVHFCLDFVPFPMLQSSPIHLVSQVDGGVIPDGPGVQGAAILPLLWQPSCNGQLVVLVMFPGTMIVLGTSLYHHLSFVMRHPQ